MIVWIDQAQNTVNFQAENTEEERRLDDLLGFSLLNANVRVPAERNGTVRRGGSVAGEIGGHESQRWIKIHRPSTPTVSSEFIGDKAVARI